MNLIIDIGNTLIKMSIFRGDECLETSEYKQTEIDLLISDIQSRKVQFPMLNKAIVSNTGKKSEKLNVFLKNCFQIFKEFDYHLKTPIKNLYKTPETLGKDRLASAVAAYNIYKGQSVLIVDCGTALTIDFIDKDGAYTGGAISPGLGMRYKALHTFTANLPLIEKNDVTFLTGNDTKSSIISGVQNGIVFEIDGFINAYKEKYHDMEVIFTGGDAFFFEKRVKNKIFADRNLVAKGLNIILNYND